MTEKQIENAILEYLNLKRVFCWKVESVGIWDQARKVYRKKHNKNHKKGISDILGIYNSRMLAIEVKKPKSYPTKEQRAFIEAVNERGGLAFVARSVEDVMEKLK